VALHCGNALLIDIGSTTTDLIAVRDGEVVASGHNDEGRLEAGELVYCGVVRTPLCSLARRMPLGGRSFNVMNEWFATTADVYRLTGELDLAHDQHPTADGASKSHDDTRQRLAHMVGHDARDATSAQWLEFAHAWRAEQLALIRANLDRVLARAGLPGDAPFVGAGCGHFLVRELARQLGRPYLGFEACVPLAAGLADWARVCAPSVAVAWLASAQAWPSQDEGMMQARFPCGS
jgi:probable H4MPT-linked C1 transfer pathway protein